ncbi:Multiple stress resistance protein BhsA precursor [Raoultella terrigena]|uniref:Multiple stress resistance protein BhsA n=1 Tax=Raoultella terrigena TaxID=577 RepID=A0A3P8K0A3_RAOTE|nr:Multiple stress resistance protein BhsA precursor [Raoultella terrigena]
MRRSLLLLATVALAAASFTARPAAPLSAPADTGPLRPSGTVSASGASNLDDLQAQLAQKAHQQGAIAWRINSAGGTNRMAGTAIIYK